METVKLFGYTAGAFAISHFFREWPLANRRFYLSHLHFNQGSASTSEGSISKFLIERARFQYCIGSSLIASLKAFQKCALPLVLLFGIEAGLRHALSVNVDSSSVMKEKMLELHLETVIAGALVGTLVGGQKQKSLRSSGEFAVLGAILGCSLAVARIIANE